MWTVIIFHWVGLSGSSDVSHSYLFANKIILFILCCIILYNSSEMLHKHSSESKSLALYFLLFLLFFQLLLFNPLLHPLLSNSPLHFIFSHSSRPSQVKKYIFSSNIHLSFLLPSIVQALFPAFCFTNPLSPSRLSPLLSLPWKLVLQISSLAVHDGSCVA